MDEGGGKPRACSSEHFYESLSSHNSIIGNRIFRGNYSSLSYNWWPYDFSGRCDSPNEIEQRKNLCQNLILLYLLSI